MLHMRRDPGASVGVRTFVKRADDAVRDTRDAVVAGVAVAVAALIVAAVALIVAVTR
jgi:hypothetical protein